MIELSMAKSQIDELFKRAIDKHEKFVISTPNSNKQVMIIQLGDLEKLKKNYADFDSIEELIDNILEVQNPVIRGSIKESWKEYQQGEVGTKQDMLNGRKLCLN